MQLSHPSRRAIQKSIETLGPSWEQAKSRTAAFDLCSATFRLRELAFSNELVPRDEELLSRVLAILGQTSLHIVACMLVSKLISIAKWSHHINGYDFLSIRNESILRTIKVPGYALHLSALTHHQHCLDMGLFGDTAPMLYMHLHLRYLHHLPA